MGRGLAVAVVASSHWLRRRWAGVVTCLSLLGWAPSIGADEAAFDASKLLGDAPGLRLRSLSFRVTGYQQDGRGYQSRAGRRGAPGSERATIFEPQLAIEATQGPRLTHRLWVPVDIVTAASPDAIDVVSSASRKNEAATVDWATQYRATPSLNLGIHAGIHLEEIWRTWQVGATVSQKLAEDNATISFAASTIFDWFDAYTLAGAKTGLSRRASSTGAISFEQVLSPTTIAEASYGLTFQDGTLGNNWNVVPLQGGSFITELLPRARRRHAVVARVAQALPSNAAIKLYYRTYADDWSIVARTVEAQLLRRVLPVLTLGIGYRYHRQSSAAFFVTGAADAADAAQRTADSDLAALDTQAVDVRASFDIPRSASGALHFDISYERYWRSNDLEANVVSCATVLSF